MVASWLIPIIIAVVIIIALMLIPGSFVWKIVGILVAIILGVTIWGMLRSPSNVA